jgi:transcriptional regulator with XRE-family HTH domain
LVEDERFYADLGRRLRWHRERRHMTQQQLGEVLDPPTTRASIANIEAGKQRVLAHTLVQLADALGASVSELLPSSGEVRVDTIREELFQKLELPDKQLRRVVEKLTSGKPRNNK